MKGVKVARSKGKVYYYHRATMTRLTPARPAAEFISNLRTLETRKSKRVAPGTLGGLIATYRASPEFAAHTARTRKDYNRVFDGIKGLDGLPLSEVSGELLYGLRDKLAGRFRSAANLFSYKRLHFSMLPSGDMENRSLQIKGLWWFWKTLAG